MTEVEHKADELLRDTGYAEWRAGQREAVVAALEGRDSLIVMPTGGGKSLCYQLPGLATSDLTIVVSPLIALMRDQWGKLSGQGHRVAMITSGMGDEEVFAALAMVRGGRADRLLRAGALCLQRLPRSALAPDGGSGRGGRGALRL